MAECSSSLPAIEHTLTEGGRISNLLSRTRECMAAQALAKARAYASGKSCLTLCTVTRDASGNTPIPSMLLNSQVKSSCYQYKNPNKCIPESIRIAEIQQRTLLNSADPLNPETRFAEYARNFPAPCPPNPAWYATAGEPKLQLKNCPLPNKPDNPVLPG
jgi:hypothetical protein